MISVADERLTVTESRLYSYSIKQIDRSRLVDQQLEMHSCRRTRRAKIRHQQMIGVSRIGDHIDRRRNQWAVITICSSSSVKICDNL